MCKIIANRNYPVNNKTAPAVAGAAMKSSGRGNIFTATEMGRLKQNRIPDILCLSREKLRRNRACQKCHKRELWFSNFRISNNG